MMIYLCNIYNIIGLCHTICLKYIKRDFLDFEKDSD